MNHAPPGALVGAMFAAVLSRVLVSVLATGYASLFIDLSWNWRMLGFTTGVALIACLLFGVVPALRATSVAPGVALRTGGRGVTANRERSMLRRGLVVTQVALSLVLLVGALLFTRTLYNLLAEQVGFDPSLVVAIVNHPSIPDRGEQAQAMRRDLRERFKALPDVLAAAQADVIPLAGTGFWNETIRIDGADSSERQISNFNRVSPEYFEALGLPLVSGRNFSEQDTLQSPAVAIVNQAFVSKFVSDGRPIGKRIRVEPAPGSPDAISEVVGVVPDTKLQDLRDEFEPMVYVASTQEQEPGTIIQFVVRPRRSAGAVIAAMSRALAEVNPKINIDARQLDQTIRDALVRERLMAALSSAFGVLAGLLAAIGLYGVMSYTVARRANEIGIRIAMGAERSDVLRMVLSETGKLVLAGLVLGTVLSIAAARSARTLLFGLQPTDPLTITLASLMLLAIGLTSGFIPARHASRVDPSVALRQE